MRPTFVVIVMGVAWIMLVYPVCCGSRTKQEQAVVAAGTSATVPSVGISATTDTSLVESAAAPAQGNGNRRDDRRGKGNSSGRDNWNHGGGMMRGNNHGRNPGERGEANGSGGRQGARGVNGYGRETMRIAASTPTGAAGKRGSAVLS